MPAHPLSRRDLLLALAQFAPAAVVLGCGGASEGAVVTAPSNAEDAGLAAADAGSTSAVDAGDAGREANVIVIGAGIAGLRAAEVLAKAGKKVIVLEGRTRIGGRIVTDRSWGVPLDLGASWIHGVTNNPIAARAASEGLRTIVADYSEALFDANGTRRPDSDVARIERTVRDLATRGTASSPDTDEPLRTALDRAIASSNFTATQRLEVEMGITSVFEHEYAADASELSANHFDDGANESGGDAVFPGGYDAIVNAVARGTDVRLGCIVTAIDTSVSPAVVLTNLGTFQGESVLVTVPLGVLKAKTIAFTPSLSPAKRDAIARLGMGTLSKTYVQFASSFWPAASELVDRIPPASERGQWVESLNVAAIVDTPALLMFNAGAFARAQEAMSDSQAIASASAALRALFGASFQAPLRTLRSNWSGDAFACGSYSFLAVGSTLADRDTLAARQGSLFFAGEACSRDHAATVHGAFTSGERAANSIVTG